MSLPLIPADGPLGDPPLPPNPSRENAARRSGPAPAPRS